jgi:hypothetical protein
VRSRLCLSLSLESCVFWLLDRPGVCLLSLPELGVLERECSIERMRRGAGVLEDEKGLLFPGVEKTV